MFFYTTIIMKALAVFYLIGLISVIIALSYEKLGTRYDMWKDSVKDWLGITDMEEMDCETCECRKCCRKRFEN